MPCYITGAFPPSKEDFESWVAQGYTGSYADYLQAKERGSGLKVFMCGKNLSFEVCPDCGSVADYLCDYPVGKRGRTCDRRLCASHAHQVGENTHYCDMHFKEWQSFRSAGPGREVVADGRQLTASNDPE